MVHRSVPRINAVTSRPHGATIVSIGYESRSVEQLIGALRRNSVDVLVDVRLNPVSRKKGFSKAALAQALSDAGIDYQHKPSLGNPLDNRDPFRRGLKSARARYLRHLQNGAASSYGDIIGLAGTCRIALLCYERDHDDCHRSCILECAQHDHPAISVLKL